MLNGPNRVKASAGSSSTLRGAPGARHATSAATMMTAAATANTGGSAGRTSKRRLAIARPSAKERQRPIASPAATGAKPSPITRR